MGLYPALPRPTITRIANLPGNYTAEYEIHSCNQDTVPTRANEPVGNTSHSARAANSNEVQI